MVISSFLLTPAATTAATATTAPTTSRRDVFLLRSASPHAAAHDWPPGSIIFRPAAAVDVAEGRGILGPRRSAAGLRLAGRPVVVSAARLVIACSRLWLVAAARLATGFFRLAACCRPLGPASPFVRPSLQALKRAFAHVVALFAPGRQG